jgi:DNA polymerase-3 subunit delta'
MIAEREFVGNTKIVRYLDKVLEKGCVSHAYLFEGPERVGKMTMALAFAAELLQDTSSDVLANPDLVHIYPDEEKKQISVEAMRGMQKSLSYFPLKAPYKVVIIEKAEMLGPSGANSILKTLEEPGATSVIILVASDMKKILATIKSRCQVLNFNAAFGPELREFLLRKGPHADIDEILELSQGRPGMAIGLLEDAELLQEAKAEKARVLELFYQGNYARMESASHIYGLEKEEAAAVLNGWIVTLRSELLKSFAETGVGTQEKKEKMKAAIEKTMLTREDILERNVNLKLAIENLVLNFK